MQPAGAIAAFAALGQAHRLAVFRMLMEAGPAGLTAGEIAQRLHVPASSLSSHLAILERANLLRSRRIQRHVFYAVDPDGTRDLILFLTRDCCGGRPELCGYDPIAQPGPAPTCRPATPLPRDTPMADRPFHVLFLCTGNSARSIMAEAALSRWGGDKFVAHSAGSHPTGHVHPMTLRVLEQEGYDTRTLRSKDWAEFALPDAPHLDFVFTVCDRAAKEVCPVWPGQPMTAHWGIEDPSAFVGDDWQTLAYFRRVYGYLNRRVQVFAALPFASLSRLALQTHLDEIGRLRDEVVV